jgi:glucuronoarabinoxylan endo-1,4-beta-xylanase
MLYLLCTFVQLSERSPRFDNAPVRCQAETKFKKTKYFPQGCVGHASHESDSRSIEGNRIQMTKGFVILFLLIGPVCHAQSVTIDWTNVHQAIDGFGATSTNDAGSAGVTLLTSAQSSFFFGTGNGQIGLSILRVGPPNGAFAYGAGNCTTVSTSCAGAYTSDVAFATSFGARIYVEPQSPPAIYTTNGSVTCTANGGGGTIALAHYNDYATWIVNFIKSLQTFQRANILALNAQGEPDFCDSASPGITLSSQQLHDFITNSLGPALVSNGLSSALLLMSDSSKYGSIGIGGTCGTDPSCMSFVGGAAWDDYDATVTIPTDTVNPTPYPAGWISSGKHYWQAEISCQSGGGGPSFCNASFDPSMTNALGWAALLDHRFAIDNVNAWLYFWFLLPQSVNSGEALLANDTGAVPLRTYVIGQYSRFIRPGYFRIDATHNPRTGVSVSAYQNTTGGNLTVVATNYTGSPVTQAFNVVNAPTFTSVTPYITSATQNIQAQGEQSVSSNSFTYTLPADSVTTFVGTSSGSTAPVPPTKVQAVVN